MLLQQLEHVCATPLKLALYHIAELFSDMSLAYKVCMSTLLIHIFACICTVQHHTCKSQLRKRVDVCLKDLRHLPDRWLTVSDAVQMNMTTTCRSNLMATQESRLRNWRLDYGVRKQCKDDVSKVMYTCPTYRSKWAHVYCLVFAALSLF